MNCNEFVDAIYGHVEGEHSPPMAEAFQEHLARCESCRRYLRSYEQTVWLIRNSGSEDEGSQPEGPTEDASFFHLVDVVLDRASTRLSSLGLGFQPYQRALYFG